MLGRVFMNLIRPMILVAACLWPSAECAFAKKDKTPARDARETVLIQTDRAAFTLDDYLNELELFKLVQGDTLTDQDRKDVFTNLVHKALLLDEASERGIDRRPEIRKKIKAMEEQMILHRLVQDLFGAALDVTDTEVREFYAQNRDRLAAPERRNVFCVTVSTESEARTVEDEAVRSKDFTMVLKKYASQKTDNYFEGVTERQLIPEFGRPVFRMPLGYVSNPIRTPLGWHIAYVSQIEPGRTYAFEDVREAIRNYLFSFKQNELLARRIEELKLKKSFRIHGDRFAEWLERQSSGLMK